MSRSLSGSQLTWRRTRAHLFLDGTDPAYCDVGAARWRLMTGETATHAETGASFEAETATHKALAGMKQSRAMARWSRLSPAARRLLGRGRSAGAGVRVGFSRRTGNSISPSAPSSPAYR